MEGYDIEPEKGTDCHERQQPASGSADFSTPVAVTSCELPADPSDHVQTEMISSDDVTPATNLVSLNDCGMQLANQGRPDDPPAVYPEETDQAQVVSGVGEKQQADSESLSKGAVCLHSVSRSTEDAEDAQMEELCSTDATQSTRSLDTSDKITTKSAEPQTSCDSQASSDGHRPPGPSNRAEVVNTNNTDAHVNLVEDRNIRASDNVPAHIQSCSGAAEQFEMMEEKCEKCVGREADSASESIVCSSEYRSVESAGGAVSAAPSSENYTNSVCKETEKSDISPCDQNESSCGQSSGDEDDDEDIITLTEEDFLPSFVITNVCSVKDDDTCMFDQNGEGECNTGIQEVSDHDSVDPDDSSSNSSGAEEHTETEQQTGNRLPLESSARKSLESSPETAATEHGTDSGDGLPPSPAASSAPRTVPEAVSPIEESSTESGIQVLGYEDRTNKLSADAQEGSTDNTNNMASIRNSDSSLEATKKQVDCCAEQEAGYSDAMDELNEEPDASDSLVMKLEPDDADFEMEEETVHSVAESVNIDTSSRSYSSGTSFDSTKRKRPFSEVETEQGRQGGEASQSKKRGIDLTCTELSDMPDEGDRLFSELSSTDLCQQAGKSDACSLTDSVAQADTQSSQVNLQPQVQAQHSMICKSLLIPSNLTAKKGNTQPCDAATKSVFLTIPSALGGDGTRSVHLTTHRAPGTFKRISLQVKNSGKEAVGRASSTTKTYQGAKRVMTKMTSQAGHKTGTDHSQGGTLSVADSSVQKVAHVMDSSPHTHKTSISANGDSTEPGEHTHSSSSVVTADTSMPVSEKRIITWKDKTQGKGSADSGTGSLLSPSFMVRAKERHIGQVSLIQPGTVGERAFLVTQTFQPVSSGVPLTSVTHPSVASTLLTPSVPSTRASAPAKVITVDSGGQASGQLAVGTSQVSTGVQNAQSASSGMKPVLVIQDVACPAVSETAKLDPKQSSQLEPVSSQAKLSASDMASLIKGKNLVPSLEPRPQPPHKSGAVNSVYRCVECNHMYSTLLGYTAHVKRMSMVIRYACMVCKTALVFFNKCTFLAHLRKHMTFNAFRGLVLNLKSYTMSVSSLPKQLLPPVEVQYMDPLMINRNQPVTCTECQETFPDTWRLAQHFSAVEFCRFEHCCSHCNMQLPTACALKAHLRLHDAKFHTFCAQPPYVCPECGLQFVTQLSLYQHLYATCLHFNRCVTLRCYACNNWYPTLESLEEHIHLKHPNTKCFKCLVCKKKFSSLLLFTHHLPHPWAQKDEKARKKVVPSCTACDDEDDLVEGRRHAQMHTESAKSIAWFGFTCLFCQDFLTMSLHTLVQHLNVKHTAYKFSCSICLQGFVMLSLLRSHVLSTHSSRDRGKRTAQYSCCCANCAASLGPDSALPHVMWHAVKKVPEVTYTTETSALVENRRSMSIVASGVNSKSFREQANTRAYFCRSCGHVFPTGADLQKHLAKSQHSVCGTFSTCPCCQRFDFASQDIFIQHTLTCITRCKDVFYTLIASQEESDAEQTRNPRSSPGDKDQAVVDMSGGIDTELHADVDMSCRTDTREQTTPSAPGHTNQIKVTNACSDSTGGTVGKGPVQTTVSVLASQTSNVGPGRSNVPGPTSSTSREAPSSSSGSGPSPQDSGTTVCSEVQGSGTVVCSEVQGSGTTVCSEVLGSGTTVRSEVLGSGTTVRSEVLGSGTTVRPEVQGSGTTVRSEVQGSGTTVRPEVQGSGTTVCSEVLASGTTVRPEVQGQSTVGPSEKSPSSSTSGGGAPNKSELSFKFDSRRTIVVFTKNGKIVGHKEMVATKETGSSKQVTRKALTTRPAKSLVDQRLVKLLISKSATSSMLHKPATEKPATCVAPSSGGQSQESSSSLQLSKSPFSVSQEQGDDDKEGLTWMEVPRDTAQPDPQQLYHPCPLCGLTYESADQLASHRASVHRGEMKTVLFCQLCKKRGKTIMLSKMNLKKHLIRRHKVGSPAAETMVSESACGQTAASSSAEAQAQASSAPKRSSTDSESSTVGVDPVRCLRVSDGDKQDYVCAKCDFSSPAMEEFHSHIKGHAVDNSVQCLECGLCYSAVSSLKKHLFMVHKVKRPDVYISQHDIRLEELPADFASHMDTLTPLGQSEEARRTAEVFHEDFYKTLPHSPKPADRKKRRRSNSDCLECNVCYKEFENEGELKSHMRNHGMAFIRSRRATP